MSKEIKFFGDGDWIEGGVETSFEEADIIVMPGGSDWNPALYKQKPIKQTHWFDHVDTMQMRMINSAIEAGKALFGICRGLQGLTIRAGGELIQDMDHDSQHPVRNYKGELYSMNSCHHQMCYPYGMHPSEYEVLSWTEELSPYHTGEGYIDYFEKDMPAVAFDSEGYFKEPEVIWYPKINALGTQGHPEWGPGDAALAFLNELVRERLKL